jgi:heme-degrading monooxygenase HmoA
VIARRWRGWTRREDADEYLAYIRETGLREYRDTPGNRGAWILRRDDGDRVEFVTLSFWDSMDAIEAFAGPEPDRAVYYPEDERFLVAQEDAVDHYELFE